MPVALITVSDQQWPPSMLLFQLCSTGALGEDNGGVEDTGDGVEGNEAPEEGLPFLVLEAMFAVLARITGSMT
jgi:hypothetical protein